MSAPLSPWSRDHVLQQIGYKEAEATPLNETIVKIHTLGLFAYLWNCVCALFGHSLEQQAARLISGKLKETYSELETCAAKETTLRADRLVRHLLRVAQKDASQEEPGSYYIDTTFEESLSYLFNTNFLLFADPRCVEAYKATVSTYYNAYDTEKASLLAVGMLKKPVPIFYLSETQKIELHYDADANHYDALVYLENNEEKNRVLIDVTPEGIVVYGKNGDSLHKLGVCWSLENAYTFLLTPQ